MGARQDELTSLLTPEIFPSRQRELPDDEELLTSHSLVKLGLRSTEEQPHRESGESLEALPKPRDRPTVFGQAKCLEKMPDAIEEHDRRILLDGEMLDTRENKTILPKGQLIPFRRAVGDAEPKIRPDA